MNKKAKNIAHINPNKRVTQKDTLKLFKKSEVWNSAVLIYNHYS